MSVSPEGILRLGVVVERAVAPIWIAETLDDLLSCRSVEIVGLAIRPSSRPRSFTMPATARALARADALVFGRRARSMAATDLALWASRHGVPMLPDVTSGGTAPPDLVLDLREDRRAPASGWEGALTWALTGVAVEAGDVHRSHPEIVEAVVEGRYTIPFELRARREDGSDVLVRAGTCPVHPSSPLVTGDYLAASTRQLIVRLLCHEQASARLRSLGRSGAFAPVHVADGSSAAFRLLSSGELARFFARCVSRQGPKLVAEGRWHLLLGRSAEGEGLVPDPRAMRLLVPRPGTYWADPFVVTFDGATHIFFEEFVYRTRRGRIAVMTLDADGLPGPPRIALDLDVHLSYPCVFVHGGRLFMVPEAADAASLDLYECVEVPDRWERCRTLVADTSLVDATVFPWEGRWWMFAGLQKPRGVRTADLLLLYSTDDPVSGEWLEHPASPVLADVTRARPAGAPISHRGRLHRLAQDGSREYGWSMAVNEVDILTAEECADHRVSSVLPDWADGLCGTHTLNRDGRHVVQDVCIVSRRPPWRTRAESLRG